MSVKYYFRHCDVKARPPDRDDTSHELFPSDQIGDALVTDILCHCKVIHRDGKPVLWFPPSESHNCAQSCFPAAFTEEQLSAYVQSPTHFHYRFH